jgi:hypothetical protein
MPTVSQCPAHGFAGVLESDRYLRQPKTRPILGNRDERSVRPLGDSGRPAVLMDGFPGNQSS